MVVSSSLTPQAALLVPISGPVVDCRGFTGSYLAIYSLIDGMSG